MLKKKPKLLKKIPTKKKLVSKITATKKAVLPTRAKFSRGGNWIFSRRPRSSPGTFPQPVAK